MSGRYPGIMINTMVMDIVEEQEKDFSGTQK